MSAPRLGSHPQSHVARSASLVCPWLQSRYASTSSCNSYTNGSGTIAPGALCMLAHTLHGNRGHLQTLPCSLMVGCRSIIDSLLVWPGSQHISSSLSIYHIGSVACIASQWLFMLQQLPVYCVFSTMLTVAGVLSGRFSDAVEQHHWRVRRGRVECCLQVRCVGCSA